MSEAWRDQTPPPPCDETLEVGASMWFCEKDAAHTGDHSFWRDPCKGREHASSVPPIVAREWDNPGDAVYDEPGRERAAPQHRLALTRWMSRHLIVVGIVGVTVGLIIGVLL